MKRQTDKGPRIALKIWTCKIKTMREIKYQIPHRIDSLVANAIFLAQKYEFGQQKLVIEHQKF